MRDITLGITFYHDFTTRAFATGIPGTLAGSPVISVLEENNATPITAGISLSVDRGTVTGLNEATVVATSGNGFAAGKSYSLFISTGTVGGVSVVGEVVGQFTVGQSAAAVISAALTSVLGALNDGAAAGEVTTTDTVMQYIKQLINILIGAPGIVAFPAEAIPANGVSLAEVIRAIHTDTTLIKVLTL
jgi:hypothetical protein